MTRLRTRVEARPRAAADPLARAQASLAALALAAILAAALALGAGGCGSGEPACDAHGAHECGAAAAGHDAHAEHDDNAANAAHDDHADHAAHEEPCDLDRSVDELLAARCEHEMPTHRCAECRYEVGVAQVREELIDRGLVQIGAAAQQRLSSEIALSGEIQFDERKAARLSPSAAGVVSRVHVDLGRRVAAGDLLVEIASSDFGASQTAYLEALIEERVAAAALDRQRELRAAQITSEREFLEAEQRHAAARMRAEAARQSLARCGLRAEEISALEQAGLPGADGLLRVRAPFPGEVLELRAVRGEQVAAGDELALVGDTRTLWVWVDLYEDQLAAVQSAAGRSPRAPGASGASSGHAAGSTGLPATVTVRAYPDEVFAGELDFIGRVMDEATRTVKARITLENPSGALRPGMFARVRLAAGEPFETVAVPSAAVLSDDGRDFVFVHCGEDFYLRRPVTKGHEAAGLVAILEGLVPGQRVVTQGAFLLKSDVLRAKMGEGCAH